MNAERLLTLATFLESVPPNRFDMSMWANGDLATDCGSAGCAMGWATQIPEFQEAGLRLSREYYYSPGGGKDLHPIFDDKRGGSFASARAFFDIELRDAEFLFDRVSYGYMPPLPEEVALRIRSFAGGCLNHETRRSPH